MSKFKKKKSGELPPVSTAALPDIVFMLLFFFMTVTTFKKDDYKVAQDFPYADQVQKLDKNDPIIYIYAGKPHERYQKEVGAQAKIQLNDKFANVDEIKDYWFNTLNNDVGQEFRYVAITALKVDGETNMGLVADIKQQLREINALKINYTTRKGEASQNYK
ncbi:biopolymer transport protein ExbD [Kordia periserrulae]|uniref:Biopolymer transport protein ExbD n=1 Tax=Kordia periserrulae TaxID=701523 RepID=A0A2T6C6L3_9FLAO|nr:biopolymer transporter ExbD [Kordia periserrulae]PTX63927.1 biopolymer transport protein ExbD [Kordia periserrulae]